MISIHPNYGKAYKLFLIAFAVSSLSLIKNFISIFTIRANIANSPIHVDAGTADALSKGYGASVMIAILLTSLYYILIARLLRKGTSWVKYLLLVFFILGIVHTAINGLEGVWEIVVGVTVKILKLWVIVLLFKVHKPATPNSNGMDSVVV